MSKELFSDGNSVCGMPLFEFLQWAKVSNETLFSKGGGPAPMYGILALPPVQRTAVWNPKQVVDLWDSLFRGLPIGSFFLVKRSGQDGPNEVRGMSSTGQTLPVRGDGFDLLDGQQRLRAMLLGLMGPVFENRYLWVDLDAKTKSHHLRIYLTSASQPFGYQPENGQKLPIADRRRARDILEQDERYKTLIKRPRLDGSERSTYDHELFQLFLDATENSHVAEPPRPYRASPSVRPLHSLLKAWCEGEMGRGSGLEALRKAFDSPMQNTSVVESGMKQLDEAFRRVASAQVALLQVDPMAFEGKQRRRACPREPTHALRPDWSRRNAADGRGTTLLDLQTSSAADS